MTVYLEPKDVPEHLRRLFSGKKFKAEVRESVEIPSTAGLWDGGSRDVYLAIRLADGSTVNFPHQNTHPGDTRRQSTRVPLASGFSVVRHTTYRGTDLGATFYVHPSDAAALLPAPSSDLSELELDVLAAHAGLKSSYGGVKDYRAHALRTRDEYKAMADRRPVPTLEAINAARESLKARALLNKAGAITVAGRNACGDRRI